MARDKNNNARDNWSEIAEQISSENEPKISEDKANTPLESAPSEEPKTKSKSTGGKKKKPTAARAKSGGAKLSDKAIAALALPESVDGVPVVAFFEERLGGSRHEQTSGTVLQGFIPVPRYMSREQTNEKTSVRAQSKTPASKEPVISVATPTPVSVPKSVATSTPETVSESVSEATPTSPAEEPAKPVKKRRRAKPADEKEAQEEDNAFGALLSQIASVAEPAKRKTVKRRVKPAPAEKTEEPLAETSVDAEPAPELLADAANVSVDSADNSASKNFLVEIADLERQVEEDSKAIFDAAYFGMEEQAPKLEEPRLDDFAPIEETSDAPAVDEISDDQESKDEDSDDDSDVESVEEDSDVEDDEAPDVDSDLESAKDGARASVLDGFGDDFWNADDDLVISWGRSPKSAQGDACDESLETSNGEFVDECAESESEDDASASLDEELDADAQESDANDARENVVTLENLDPSSPEALEAFFAADFGEESLGFAPRKQPKANKSASKSERCAEPRESQEPSPKATKKPRFDDVQPVEEPRELDASEEEAPTPREQKPSKSQRQSNGRERRRDRDDARESANEPQAAKRREPREEIEAQEARRPKRREQEERALQDQPRQKRREFNDEREIQEPLVQEPRRAKRFEQDEERVAPEPRRSKRYEADDEREVQDVRRARRMDESDARDDYESPRRTRRNDPDDSRERAFDEFEEPRRARRLDVDDEYEAPRRPTRADYADPRDDYEDPRRSRRFDPDDSRDDYEPPRRPKRREYDDERELQEPRRPRRREDAQLPEREQREPVAESPAPEKKSPELLIPSWDLAVSYVVNSNLKRRGEKSKK